MAAGLKLAEAFVKLGFDKTTFNREFKKVQTQFQAGINNMVAFANQAKIAVIALGGGIAFATKTAASFEKSMSRVKAITGATAEDFSRLSAKARELGKTTVFTADEAAAAMANFAVAGFTTEEILNSITSTLDLAAAGQLDMATASDIVAKAMRGMQIDTSKTQEVVDTLAKAFTTSNTNLIQLGEAFKFVGPIGAAAGKSLGELTAAIQLMSDAGIQGGLAGTSLRNILIRLQAQPSEVKKEMRKLGVEIATTEGKMRPLADIIDDLNTKMAGLTDIQKATTVANIAGLRAIAGFTVLLEQGGDTLRRYERRLDAAGGTSRKIAKIMIDNLAGSMQILKSAISELLIVIGNQFLPTIRKMTEGLTAITNAAAEISPGIKRVIASYSLLIVKTAALAAAGFGLVKVFALVKLGVIALVSRVGLLTAGIALLAGAWVDAKLKGQSFSESLRDLTNDLTGFNDEVDRAKERSSADSVEAEFNKVEKLLREAESRPLTEAEDKRIDALKARLTGIRDIALTEERNAEQSVKKSIATIESLKGVGDFFEEITGIGGSEKGFSIGGLRFGTEKFRRPKNEEPRGLVGKAKSAAGAVGAAQLANAVRAGLAVMGGRAAQERMEGFAATRRQAQQRLIRLGALQGEQEIIEKPPDDAPTTLASLEDIAKLERTFENILDSIGKFQTFRAQQGKGIGLRGNSILAGEIEKMTARLATVRADIDEKKAFRKERADAPIVAALGAIPAVGKGIFELGKTALVVRDELIKGLIAPVSEVSRNLSELGAASREVLSAQFALRKFDEQAAQDRKDAAEQISFTGLAEFSRRIQTGLTNTEAMKLDRKRNELLKKLVDAREEAKDEARDLLVVPGT